jgi:hypothetical protein
LPVPYFHCVFTLLPSKKFQQVDTRIL